MDSYDNYDDLIIIMFYVLDDNDEKVVVKIILQVPWIMMFINDKKKLMVMFQVSWIRRATHPIVLSSGSVTFTSDSRVCYLLLSSMMMMVKVMLMGMIIIMLMMATSPSRQTPGSVDSFTPTSAKN